MSGFSLYGGVLFAHVLTAVALVGATLVSPLLKAALLEATSIAELRGLLRYHDRSSKWKPLAALGLLATGVYLGSLGWWSQPWFYVAVGGWLANCAIAIAVIQRAGANLADAATRADEGTIGPELDALRRSAAWSFGTGAMIANDVALLYIMFNKPALLPSLAVVATLQLLAACGTAWRHRAASAPQRLPAPA